MSGEGSETPAPPLPGYRIYDPIDPFENQAGPFFWRELAAGVHCLVLRAEPRHGIVRRGETVLLTASAVLKAIRPA